MARLTHVAQTNDGVIKFKDPLNFQCKGFQHSNYQLVLLEAIGWPIQLFRNTKELVQVFRDALQAHRLMLDMANILHGDISAANMMVTDGGGGLLIDWDLSKHLINSEGGPQQAERMGTWQFMASRLTMDDTEPPMNPDDDLESFRHILLWTALHHCEHQLDDLATAYRRDIYLDTKYYNENGLARSGLNKLNGLGTSYITTSMKLGSKPLEKLLIKTSELLCSRYFAGRDEEKHILEIQRIWETLQIEHGDENLAIPKLLRVVLEHESLHDAWMPISKSFLVWKRRHRLRDRGWMEKIFEAALDDPTANWDVGSANVQRKLPDVQYVRSKF